MSNRVSGVVIPFPHAIRAAPVRRRAAAPVSSRPHVDWGATIVWAAEALVLAVILLAVAFNAAVLLAAFGALPF